VARFDNGVIDGILVLIFPREVPFDANIRSCCRVAPCPRGPEHFFQPISHSVPALGRASLIDARLFVARTSMPCLAREHHIAFGYHIVSEAIEPLIADEVIDDMLFQVKGGKESTIFCCSGGVRSRADLLAVKV